MSRRGVATVDFYARDEMFCDWFLCSNCNRINIAEGFTYCPDCGRWIDWGSAEPPAEERE